jgi:hypothetical protein
VEAGVAVDADTQITELQADDHACLTFCESEELLDLTAAFVRDGLAGGLKVVWLSDEPQALAELAGRGLAVEVAAAAGQMVVLANDAGLLADRAFDARHAMSWLSGQVAAFRREGYPGLRVAVDMSWALRPTAGVEQLPGFEQGVGAVLAGSQVSMLCQYDRDRFDPVTLAAVTVSHDHSVAAATYHDDGVLRICRQYAPAGVRLAGEIDHRAAEPLSTALQEALRLDGDITVNMARLFFIDVSSTRMIIDTARSLPRPRVMTLRCRPAVASSFLYLGAADIPGVNLVVVHDQ